MISSCIYISVGSHISFGGLLFLITGKKSYVPMLRSMIVLLLFFLFLAYFLSSSFFGVGGMGFLLLLLYGGRTVYLIILLKIHRFLFISSSLP